MVERVSRSSGFSLGMVQQGVSMDLLVFDVDGTLTATNEVDGRCFAQAGRELFGLVLDLSWRSYPHRTDSGILRHSFLAQLRRAPTAEEMAAFRRRFLGLLEQEFGAAPENFRAVAGAPRAIAAIAEQRTYALALATGGWRTSALFKLEQAGFAARRLPAAFADDAEAREEIARIAVARASLHHQQRFDRIVLVGDSDCDVATAARIGAGFVGVAADGNEEPLRAEGAQWVLRDYEDFDAFIATIEAARHRA